MKRLSRKNFIQILTGMMLTIILTVSVIANGSPLPTPVPDNGPVSPQTGLTAVAPATAGAQNNMPATAGAQNNMPATAEPQDTDEAQTAIAPTRPLSDMTATPGWPEGPDISSRSAYVIELGSGEVLYAKNENEDRYPASITKIMTAMVVLENCPDLNAPVTFSHDAVTDIEEGGANGNIKEGMVLTVEECLYGLMLNSINECGYALAEHVAGSVENFASMMNAKASAIGCTNTNFTNPHGLNDENHRTTAHDMALIYWNALQNPQFVTIDSTTSYKIQKNENHGQLTLSMHHKMMQKDSGLYDSRVIAGKTGYTSKAKHTLATFAEKDGAQIICICMKESESGDQIYKDTKSLLNYAFDNFTLANVAQPQKKALMGLRAASPVPLVCDSSDLIYVPGSGDEITVSFAPASEGDPAGCVYRMLISSSNGTPVAKYITVDPDFISNYGGNQDVPGSNIPGQTADPGTPGGDTLGQTTDPGTPGGDTPGQSGTNGSDTPESNENGTGIGTVMFGILKVLMWIAVAAIAGIIIYWLIIQMIKRNRRKKALERADRRSRMQKIRSKSRSRAQMSGYARPESSGSHTGHTHPESSASHTGHAQPESYARPGDREYYTHSSDPLDL